jgi:hypothetical protein
MNALEKEKKISSRPKLQENTKELLNELALKIAHEFWIDVSQVKELIRSQSNLQLESLKGIVQETELSGEINFQKLKTVLNGARNVVEKMSRNEIELLKWSIQEDKISPETDFYISTRLLSAGTLRKLYHPEWMQDQIVWVAIGLLNSAEATVKLLYDIGAGIVKTPYHIYLIASGKWEYQWRGRI